MTLSDKVRLAVAVTLVMPLAVFAGLHSLSSVKTPDRPDQAVSLYPRNGPAQSSLALIRFFAVVRESGALSGTSGSASARDGEEARRVLASAAAAAIDAAAHAYRLEPLSPKAHAVLALAQADQAAKAQIVDLASSLNKRQLALQGLVLEKSVAEGSYRASMEAVDQTLRAHPEVSDKFFPLLVQMLSKEVTLPQFVQLLNEPSPWRENFLRHAARDPNAVKNAGTLRTRLELEDDELDKKLIMHLVEQGHLETAFAVHDVVRPRAALMSPSGHLRWLADYPPLEWRLIAQRGMRAVVDKEGRAVSVDIDPGMGGIIASRLIVPPSERFRIRLEHDIAVEGPKENLKIQLGCFSERKPFFEGIVKNKRQDFMVEVGRNNCASYRLDVIGRAWTGGTPVKGRIYTVQIS